MGSAADEVVSGDRETKMEKQKQPNERGPNRPLQTHATILHASSTQQEFHDIIDTKKKIVTCLSHVRHLALTDDKEKDSQL